MNADYAGLTRALLPEAALVFGALVVLGFDLVAGRKLAPAARVRLNAVLAIIALLSALGGTLLAGATTGPVFGGVLTLDPLSCASRLGVIVLSLLTVTLCAGTLRQRQPAEFFAIVLVATSGFTLMAAAQQQDRWLFVAQLGQLSIGSIRFDCLQTGRVAVSLYLDPELLGLGLGQRLLLAGERQMQQFLRSPFSLEATVMPGNTASQRLFEGCGYDGGPLNYQKAVGKLPPRAGANE